MAIQYARDAPKILHYTQVGVSGLQSPYPVLHPQSDAAATRSKTKNPEYQELSKQKKLKEAPPPPVLSPLEKLKQALKLKHPNFEIGMGRSFPDQKQIMWLNLFEQATYLPERADFLRVIL